MAFPAIVKFTAAGQLLNQRSVFTSLLQVMGDYITGITNQAIAKGYTCAGSCDGTTGAMDGVNRCTNAAGFAVKATIAGAAQSWIVITAANGAQTLFTYQGATNDIARISCSPGGLFVAAGTPAQQPTATDEVVGTSAATLIGATASGDRLWNVWIDSAHNGWRACVFRSNVLVGSLIGAELFDAAYLGTGASCAVATWCHAHTAAVASLASLALGAYAASSAGGSTRMTVSGTPLTVNMGATAKLLGAQTITENGTAQELNSSNYLLRAIGLYSNTTSAKGDVGNRYDWHFDSELLACGALDSGKNWIYLNNASAAASAPGTLWPWDGVSSWTGS